MGIAETERKSKIKSILDSTCYAMNSLNTEITAIENLLQLNSLTTTIEEIETHKQILNSLMPYKNSLDSIYKSLYDVKQKALSELSEILGSEVV